MGYPVVMSGHRRDWWMEAFYLETTRELRRKNVSSGHEQPDFSLGLGRFFLPKTSSFTLVEQTPFMCTFLDAQRETQMPECAGRTKAKPSLPVIIQTGDKTASSTPQTFPACISAEHSKTIIFASPWKQTSQEEETLWALYDYNNKLVGLIFHHKIFPSVSKCFYPSSSSGVQWIWLYYNGLTSSN